eukprot:Mrub_06687.p1 GENE.Mrub_06687~~Mrub_06687.p1  ORF type:complete len:184 (+),score=32.09 Mrub_06687:94-645(+)
MSWKNCYMSKTLMTKTGLAKSKKYHDILKNDEIETLKKLREYADRSPFKASNQNLKKKLKQNLGPEKRREDGGEQARKLNQLGKDERKTLLHEAMADLSTEELELLSRIDADLKNILLKLDTYKILKSYIKKILLRNYLQKLSLKKIKKSKTIKLFIELDRSESKNSKSDSNSKWSYYTKYLK